MPLYGGSDLHAHDRVVVLLNEQDQVLYQKRLPNHLPTILDLLAPYHVEIMGFVVESTSNWYWLVDGFMEVGYRVHVANPAAMQHYSGLKSTDDHSEHAGWHTCSAWGCDPKGISTPRPSGRCRIYCVNALTSCVSTRPMC